MQQTVQTFDPTIKPNLLMYLQYYRLLYIELKNTRKDFEKLKLEHNYVSTLPTPKDSPYSELKFRAEVAVQKEPE